MCCCFRSVYYAIRNIFFVFHDSVCITAFVEACVNSRRFLLQIWGGEVDAVGAMIETPKTPTWGCAEGCSPLHWKRLLGLGLCASPYKFSIFELNKASTWYIFGSNCPVELNENWSGEETMKTMNE